MPAGDATSIAARGLRMSRRDPTRTVDAAEGLEYLNECHRAILTDGTPWTFLIVTGQVTLAAGTSRYTLSSLATALSATNGIERIVSIVNDTEGSRPLKGMDWPELERLAHSTQDDPQGTPIAYAQIGLGSATPTVLFWPTPTQAFTMGVVARLAVVDLVGADLPLLPASHAPSVLAPYVAARMWDQQGGNEAANMAAAHEARHERALRRLIDAYGSARPEDMTFADPTLYEHLEPGVWTT